MKPGPDRVMTKTLVQELREDADTYYDQRADDNDCWNVTAALERKAADEIERLRSALESLLTAYEGLSHARACVGDPPDPEAVAARKALGAPVEPSGCPEHGMEHFFEGMCIKCGVVPAMKSGGDQ